MKRLLILIFVLVSIQVSAQVPGDIFGVYDIGIITVTNYDPDGTYKIKIWENNELVKTYLLIGTGKVSFATLSRYKYKMATFRSLEKDYCLYPPKDRYLDDECRFDIPYNYRLGIEPSKP